MATPTAAAAARAARLWGAFARGSVCARARARTKCGGILDAVMTDMVMTDMVITDIVITDMVITDASLITDMVVT